MAPEPAQAQPSADYAILQEAAEWFAVLRGEDASHADQQEWERWHAMSAVHRAAWRRVEAVSAEFRQLPGEAARQALDDAGPRQNDAQRRSLVKGLLALSLTAGLGGAMLLRRDTRSWVASLNATEKTAIGSVRQLALADGSQLWLNTATALDVDYGDNLRRIALHEGEIYIVSARDSRQPARALVVDTVHGRLRALGTRFSVQPQGDTTLLAVYEGRVEVAPRDGGAPRIVPAGRQVRFGDGAIGEPFAADPNAAAWIEYRLQPEQMRLDDFLAQLSRYRRGHLGCAPEVAHLRLVGSYPLADTDRILAALEATLPVRIHRLHDWWVTVEPLPQNK
ncbi:FecR domain-containing protein [Janthinobacterium sp. SUN118]|uniref:FecR domain-containing protein n=1 Tax=Janthinobacterium sp. SUN118 TaxID=3004100 RepID=UPI0025B0C1B4|nr:FecR domain-containing protein [Janthinobacterium sp. SUN118]MDN2712106.1 FecR domain-containing protein [Janthinobacterium sp. SUN118]